MTPDPVDQNDRIRLIDAWWILMLQPMGKCCLALGGGVLFVLMLATSRIQAQSIQDPASDDVEGFGPHFTAQFGLQSDWEQGYCGVFKITNRSTQPVQNWQLDFQLINATITSSWSGTFTQSGSQILIHPQPWNTQVDPGQAIEVGFCATQTAGSRYLPEQVSLGRTRHPFPLGSNAMAITDSRLTVRLGVQSEWEEGYCALFVLENGSVETVSEWQLQFNLDQAAISSIWNGTVAPQGSERLVNPLTWNESIAPGQSLEVGFCANKLSRTDYLPTDISLNYGEDRSAALTQSDPSLTGSDLTVQFGLQSAWEGYCATFQVKNGSDELIADWQIQFTLEKASITSVWNGSVAPQGSLMLMNPQSWNDSISPGQAFEVGFCANKLAGEDYLPHQISLTYGDDRQAVVTSSAEIR